MQDSISLGWVIAAMNPVSLERDQVRPVVIVTHQNTGAYMIPPISDENLYCLLQTKILAVACLWVENYSGKLSTLLLLQCINQCHSGQSTCRAHLAASTQHCSLVAAERLSVRLIIVQARRRWWGLSLDLMLYLYVCLSVMGLRLKYMGLRIVYVPLWHVLLMMTSYLRLRTRRIEDDARTSPEMWKMVNCSTKEGKTTR